MNITGNLTRDPELRATQGGTQVLHLGVAVNDRRRNPQTGNWEDYPNFIDCVMFGTRAEAIQRYLSKGTKVAIEGRLRYSSWERDGQKRSKIEVVIDEIEFMSSRQGGNSSGYGQQQGGYQQRPQQSSQRRPQQGGAARPNAQGGFQQRLHLVAAQAPAGGEGGEQYERGQQQSAPVDQVQHGSGDDRRRDSRRCRN